MTTSNKDKIEIYRIDKLTPDAMRPYRVRVNGEEVLDDEGKPRKFRSVDEAQRTTRPRKNKTHR